MSGSVVLVGRVVDDVCLEPDWNPGSDPKKMLRWSKTAGGMAGTQKDKAVKLCNHACLVYSGDNQFLSLPLDTNHEIVFEGKTYKKVASDKDYNRDPSPYCLHKLFGTDEWVCTCQWNTKFHLPCSHILALKIEFKRKKFGRNL